MSPKPLSSRSRLLGVLAASLVLAFSSRAASAVDVGGSEALLKRFLHAVEEHSYDEFVAPYVDQGPAVAARVATQKAETMKQLDLMSGALSSRLKSGYKVSFLGTLKHGEDLISLWKLEYEDRGDDDLAFLVTTKGAVTGFGVRPPWYLPGS